MLSCDYNGWTDAPEDEREELDRYFSDVVRPEVGTCPPAVRGDRAAVEGADALDLAIGLGERPMIRLLSADRPVVARP